MIIAGFAAHRSVEGWIGPWSPGYTLFLVALTGVLSIPVVAVLLARRAGESGPGRRVVLAAGLLLLGLYGAAEIAYAAIREHRFDPFLQFPGARFEGIPQGPGVDRIRLVTMGGSTTHGGHLPPEERYPAVLETLLNQNAGDRPWEVLNAGMDWWTTKHSHINYVTYLRRWKPEVAVIMHTINDLYRSFEAPRYTLGSYDPQWTHFYGPAIRGARPRTLMGSLLNSWTFWEFERRWFARQRYREVDYPPESYRSLPDYEFSLRSLVTTLKADGVEVVLMTEPSLYRDDLTPAERQVLWFASAFCVRREGLLRRSVPSPSSMARAMAAFNDVVRKVAEEEGTVLVDLERLLPRTTEVFGDDVHHTQAGAREVAARAAAGVLALPSRGGGRMAG